MLGENKYEDLAFSTETLPQRYVYLTYLLQVFLLNNEIFKLLFSVHRNAFLKAEHDLGRQARHGDSRYEATFSSLLDIILT